MGFISFFLVACCIVSISADEIIGGDEVCPHSMPYMAFVKFDLPQKKSERCGGILISEDIVLTAAHCNGMNMKVLLGAHNVVSKEDSWQEIKVCKIAPHQYYNKSGNDIMLLKLTRKALLNRYVLPLSISDRSGKVVDGSVCSVAGWGGYKKYNDDLSPTLRKVDVKVISKEICSKTCKNIDVKNIICAGDKQKYSSNGDSGGPLFCGKDLLGIVHGALSEKSYVCLYTKVSSYLRWIKTTMHTMKCKTEM